MTSNFAVAAPMLGAATSRAADPAEGKSAAMSIYTVAAVCGTSMLLFGYNTAVISGSLLPIAHEWPLDTLHKEGLAGTTVLFAALAALIAPFISSSLGRKPVLLLASLFYMLGAVLAASSPNYPCLFASRSLLGLGCGLTSSTAPMFLSECTLPTQRGWLLALSTDFACVGGQVVAGVTTALFVTFVDQPVGNWRWPMGLAALPAVCVLLCVPCLPESPRFLVQHGRHDTAHATLRALHGEAAAASEMASIEGAVRAEAEARELAGGPDGGFAALWYSRGDAAAPLRRACAVGLVMMLAQHLAAVNIVVYYVPSIVSSSAGSADAIDPKVSTWVGALCNVVQFCGW